jgi:hypothetical protein
MWELDGMLEDVGVRWRRGWEEGMDLRVGFVF